MSDNTESSDINRVENENSKFCAFYIVKSCVFLVPDYGKVVFRSFNFDSIDVQTETVLSAGCI